MIIITNYQLLSDEEENLICVSRESTAVCPICGALLCPRDSRKRIMKNYGGICTYIRIRRMKCHACGKLHHELPDILVPYKHYAAEVIENVVDEIVTSASRIAEDYPGEETMKRWKRWIQRNIHHLETCLNQILSEHQSVAFLKASKYLKSIHYVSLELLRQEGAGWLSAITGIIYRCGLAFLG